ncbi:MAG: VWA-like domain-containing protein [Caldilineaceae bacterium]
MSTRDRIRQIVERWFLVEPLLFAVWTTHDLVLEPRIATLRVRQGKIEYNPAFIEGLDKRALEAVLRFEAVRILLKHPYQRRKENAAIAYLASNVTLQEYLQSDLPFPRARDLFGTDEFNHQYFEFYYYHLLDQLDSAAGAPLAGSGTTTGIHASTVRDHAAGAASPAEPPPLKGEAAPETEELSPLAQYAHSPTTARENTEDWDEHTLFDERINDVIRIAQASNRWGTIAGQLREQVLALLKPKLDYRAVLRQFRTSILANQRVLTRMKPSRRYGFQYMGSRRDFTTRLLFAVDVSGSIPSADLERGFSTLNRFFRYGIETLDVIQFDTEVKGELVTLKRARQSVQVVGRGGTSFAPLMAYIDEHRDYDGLIIFTDGYAPIPPRPQNRRTRILWLFNHEANYQAMAHGLRDLGLAAFLKA